MITYMYVLQISMYGHFYDMHLFMPYVVASEIGSLFECQVHTNMHAHKMRIHAVLCVILHLCAYKCNTDMHVTP